MLLSRLFAKYSHGGNCEHGAKSALRPGHPLGLLGMWVLLLVAPSGYGAVVGVRYTGYVNYLDNASAGFPIPVAINDPFELTFYFDTAVADSLPTDPTNGRYENAITWWSARIGDQAFASTGELNYVIQSFGNVIAVTNNGLIPNYASAVGDAYQVGTSAFMPGEITVHGSVSLRNSGYPPTNPLSTDELIAGPVETDIWGNRDLALSFWDPQAGGRTIFGIATSSAVVPIPAAVWLFGSALGLMGVMRRKISS